MPGATHVDLYDVLKFHAITIPKLETFFRDNLHG